MSYDPYLARTSMGLAMKSDGRFRGYPGLEGLIGPQEGVDDPLGMAPHIGRAAYNSMFPERGIGEEYKLNGVIGAVDKRPGYAEFVNDSKAEYEKTHGFNADVTGVKVGTNATAPEGQSWWSKLLGDPNSSQRMNMFRAGSAFAGMAEDAMARQKELEQARMDRAQWLAANANTMAQNRIQTNRGYRGLAALGGE